MPPNQSSTSRTFSSRFKDSSLRCKLNDNIPQHSWTVNYPKGLQIALASSPLTFTLHSSFTNLESSKDQMPSHFHAFVTPLSETAFTLQSNWYTLIHPLWLTCGASSVNLPQNLLYTFISSLASRYYDCSHLYVPPRLPSIPTPWQEWLGLF